MASGGGWVQWGVIGVLFGCSACSFLNERFPPSTPAALNAPGASGALRNPEGSPASEPKHAHPCPIDGYQNPLLDTLSAAAGGTWIWWANNRAKPKAYVPASYDNGIYTPEQPTDPGDNPTVTHVARAFGWSTLIVFGASAVYGIIVEEACTSYRQRLAHPSLAPATKAAERHGFPSSVPPFDFTMTLVQAGTACAANHRAFQVEGALAHCVNAAGSSDPSGVSDVWLRYSFGKPAEITLVYRAAAGKLNEQYRSLSTALRSAYGEPQVQPPNLSEECSASLEQCLAAEEHPGGPVWHWPDGSIEIRPAWRDERALIEVHYTREE